MSRYESVIPRLKREQQLEMTHTTKDGERIKLRDMEEGHLLRTIKWIERKSLETGYPETDYFDDENGNAGEVVVGRYGALESLRLYHYEDYVDVYNYRFGDKERVNISF